MKVRIAKFERAEAALRSSSKEKVFWKYAANLRDSKFSSYKIEIQNRVMQNDVTRRVTNSDIFIEILLSGY